MIIYHGTVNTFLPAIQQSGLQLKPENSYQAISTFNGREIHSEGIYFTTRQLIAYGFAITKAQYLRAEPGDFVGGLAGSFVKELGTPLVKDALPAVLTLDVPESIVGKFRVDNEVGTSQGSARRSAFWYDGIVPAKYIKDVWQGKNDEDIRQAITKVAKTENWPIS